MSGQLFETLEPRVLMSAAITATAHFDRHFGPPEPRSPVASAQLPLAPGRENPEPPAPLIAPAPGDANVDGTVNFADFVILSNRFGQLDAGWTGGDFNGDGITDFADYITLSNSFGATPAWNVYDNRIVPNPTGTTDVWFNGSTDFMLRQIPNTGLFSVGGPSPGDAIQDAGADCWLVAALSSVAQASPSVIAAHVRMDAGGGVLVTLGGYNIHEPLAIPMFGLGPGGWFTAGWAYYVEEAMVWYRTKGANPTYAGLDIGFPTEVTSALGIVENVYTPLGSTPTQIFNAIAAAVALGKPGQVTTLATGTLTLVPDHAYSIVSTEIDNLGIQWVHVRNPWGFDPSDPDQQGEVTLTISNLLRDAPYVCIGI